MRKLYVNYNKECIPTYSCKGYHYCIADLCYIFLTTYVMIEYAQLSISGLCIRKAFRETV